MARIKQPTKPTQKENTNSQPKRNNVVTNKEYLVVKKYFIELIRNKFLFFEKHGSDVPRDKVLYYNKGCTRSSFNPQLLNFLDYYEKVDQLVEFANISERDVSLDHNFYKDTKNADITIIPLIALLADTDPHQIIIDCKLELPKNRQVKDIRQYVIECCFVNKIWLLSSKNIRETIIAFFENAFPDEGDYLQKLLSEKDTFVLIIINRMLKDSNNIEKEHIITGSIFSANGKNATFIDFIHTSEKYQSHGYGTLILHMSQVFASEYNLNHKKLGSSTEDNEESESTYLFSSTAMVDYFTMLGFKESSVEVFSSNEHLECFNNRRNMSKQKGGNEPDNEMQLLSTNAKVPRQINYVKVVNEVDIEHSLYDKEMFKSYKVRKPIKSMRKKFIQNIEQRIESIINHTGSERDSNIMNNADNFVDFLNIKFNQLLFFQIGKWFKACFDDELSNFDQENYMESQTMLIALENLEMQFYQHDYDNTDIDNIEQWVCIRCALCQKKAFIKKSSDERLVDFLLKGVFSVWYAHVFCYEANQNNPFDVMNPAWNICEHRGGVYLHNLRKSVRFDTNRIFPSEDGVHKLYFWKKYLEYFFVGFKVNYVKMLHEFIINISKFKSLHQKTNTLTVNQGTNIQGQKRKRKSLLTNYREEHIIGKENNIVVSQKTRNNAANTKFQREIKKKRHEDETEWNEVFYTDLELQLRFDKMEYVDVGKTNEFYEESLAYINDREQLKDRDYKNHWNELQKENHFLAHLDNGDVVVLEDDWFKQYDDNGDFSHYVITTQTYKNLLRRCNRQVSLNKSDKNRIKKHVEQVKDMCEIQYIKKYLWKKDDDNRYEYINYKEGMASASDAQTTKKILHSSVSRLDYIGIDKNGRSHRLSNDWLELNFKKNQPELYQRICKLSNNQRIEIPRGSSDFVKVRSKIDRNDYRVKNKYHQGSDPSCLFSSLAIAVDYIGKPKLGLKLIETYYQNFYNQDSHYVTMNDVLQATQRNAFHKKFEPKFKFSIKKVAKPNIINLLPPNDMEKDIIYHCILTNHHAVAICNNLIFDPGLTHSICFNETNIRICAEVNTHEKTSELVLKAYIYS